MGCQPRKSSPDVNTLEVLIFIRMGAPVDVHLADQLPVQLLWHQSVQVAGDQYHWLMI